MSLKLKGTRDLDKNLYMSNRFIVRFFFHHIIYVHCLNTMSTLSRTIMSTLNVFVSNTSTLEYRLPIRAFFSLLQTEAHY